MIMRGERFRECPPLWSARAPAPGTRAAASALENAADPNWCNTINLRCSFVFNATFPSFVRGQNR
jgi:hypothetical protein